MNRNSGRPLSPHLSIWKWGPNMLVSILHRATGVGLATVGAGLFTWWLAAAASGPENYQAFLDCIGGPVMRWIMLVVGVGLTWAAFQHVYSGLRHFVLDTGAGYELRTNKFWSTMTVVGSVLTTGLVWAYLIWGR